MIVQMRRIKTTKDIVTGLDNTDVQFGIMFISTDSKLSTDDARKIMKKASAISHHMQLMPVETLNNPTLLTKKLKIVVPELTEYQTTMIINKKNTKCSVFELYIAICNILAELDQNHFRPMPFEEIII